MKFNKIKIVYIDETGQLQESIVDFGDPIEPGDPTITLVSMQAYLEYTQG